MARCVAALLVALIPLSSVDAALDRKELPSEDKFIPLKSVLTFCATATNNDEFRITEKTEVLLDGRRCRYDQVPDGASIILLETVTNLSKEISRIHFRSPRQTAMPPSK